MFVSLLQINIIYSDVNKFQKLITVLEVKANLYALPPQREGKTKVNRSKSKNQQSTGSMGFPETKFTWHQAKNWPCLVDKNPAKQMQSPRF